MEINSLIHTAHTIIDIERINIQVIDTKQRNGILSIVHAINISALFTSDRRLITVLTRLLGRLYIPPVRNQA